MNCWFGVLGNSTLKDGKFRQGAGLSWRNRIVEVVEKIYDITMALLFPTLENIEKLKVKPEEGELKLLNFLKNNLDDSYEVYFQPYLNGDNPDVILMRKESGVMIIEVKDWDLKSYEINPEENWVLKGGKKVAKSPIQQVSNYKKNIYNLHIEALLEKEIKNPKLFSIVTCAIYFHKASGKQIDEFLTKDFQDDEEYLKRLNYFQFFGFDTLNTQNFKKVLSKIWLDKKSYLFDEELYKSFKRYFQPPVHLLEQGKHIKYTDEQKRIIESKKGGQQKIKGFSGSGKTLALAKRAVNAHLRTKEKVLILTYNISLRNYIHDKINEVRENFGWENFIILHYHRFIKSHKNNVNLLQDEEIEAKSIGIKFKTILIDEVQDYKKEWIQNVKKFLAEGGEFIVFGDEKQNIYQRELEDKKPYTGIPGQWNILKGSLRASRDIANLAEFFQREFFTDKYERDDIEFHTPRISTSLIEYFYMAERNEDKIIEIYQEVLKETNVHDNDVCFLSSKIEVLRSIDKEIRDKLHKKTNTMFESQEMYVELKRKHINGNGELNEKNFKRERDDIRRNKKFNFWMNPGTTKLSTIHSFKGWDINTLFLIIERESDDNDDEIGFTTDELIYTAITRCMQNLIIINITASRYDNFFRKNIEKSYNI